MVLQENVPRESVPRRHAEYGVPEQLVSSRLGISPPAFGKSCVCVIQGKPARLVLSRQYVSEAAYRNRQASTIFSGWNTPQGVLNAYKWQSKPRAV